MQLCNFYRHVYAEFGQSVHDVNSLSVTEDKQCSLRWKNEIRGSPKVLVGLKKSKDKSWPVLASMQVLPVLYTQRWIALTISLALGLGPGLAMCKLICTHEIHMTLIQQQGYQHAGLVNLCLVHLWRFDTVVRTYNCSPCSKCFIPFCEMATAVAWNSLFLRSYMQYSTELQKADGYIQSIQWGAYHMALLQLIAVSFSPTSQCTST